MRRLSLVINCISIAMILPFPLLAQRLLNPSFELNMTAPGIPPHWWWCNANCTPDIQPGAWDQHAPASHGSTYLGLVARTDGSWEAVQQPLTVPLHEDSCYLFDIDLLFNPAYVTPVWEPGILRIWGAKSSCDRSELLWSSPPVANTSWETYHVVMSPSGTYTHWILETFYAGDRRNYHAVVMMDNIRHFTAIPQPSVTLGNDTTIWQGQGFWLNTQQQAYMYNWNDGSTGTSLYISEPGLYSVTATDYKSGCKCTAYKRVYQYECGTVNVYPIPATNQVNIDVHGLKASRIEVFDLLGRLVFMDNDPGEKVEAYVLKTAGLQDAAYILVITSEYCKVRKKIIIDR